MKKRQSRSTYLYGVSFPLIILVILIIIGSYFFYTKYKDRMQFSEKQDTVRNELMEKKEELTKVIITQDDLNKKIEEQAIGKGIGENTLESATAKILDDTVIINGRISDGTIVDTTLGMSSDGQGVFIKELELTDAGPFASVKETLLRTFLKATVDGMLKQGEEEGFVTGEIENGQITIYLNK